MPAARSASRGRRDVPRAPRGACAIRLPFSEEAIMTLTDAIQDSAKKGVIVKDCCALVDEEVSAKGGLSGLAVKAGYKAVKGIKPGFIAEVVDKLLPEFAAAMDPIWEEAKTKGDAVGHFTASKSRVAEALLAVTDGKAKNAKSAVVRSTYDTLRGSAKKNVEEAVPRLGKLLDKHAK
jgi:hypothetical protein